jgi:hypothetical protein
MHTHFYCAACLQDARNIYVVQELCHGGDLADLMSVSGTSATSTACAACVSGRAQSSLQDNLCTAAECRLPENQPSTVNGSAFDAVHNPAPMSDLWPPVHTHTLSTYLQHLPFPFLTHSFSHPPAVAPSFPTRRPRRASCQSLRPQPSSDVCWSSWQTAMHAPSAMVM